jgi:hypothetical protein
MIFIIIIFTIAFLLEGIGTLVSVIGLTQLFSFDWIIISLATTFDLAKIATVSFLYREWNRMPKLLKGYMTIAAGVLMIITSAGAAGYLSSSFQKAILPTKQAEISVKAIGEEKQKLELRKKEIDNQIANLPADMVKGRTKLINNFKTETDHINNRLIELDKELPKIQSDLIDKNSHAGPITYLAEALSISSEKAMGYIVGLIIFVFDPLAIALILAGNYLISIRNKPKKQEIEMDKNVLQIQEEDTKEETIANHYFSRLEQDIEDNNIDDIEEEPKEEIVVKSEEEIVVEEPKQEEPIYEAELSKVNSTRADVEHIGLQTVGGMNKFYR